MDNVWRALRERVSEKFCLNELYTTPLSSFLLAFVVEKVRTFIVHSIYKYWASPTSVKIKQFALFFSPHVNLFIICHVEESQGSTERRRAISVEVCQLGCG